MELLVRLATLLILQYQCECQVMTDPGAPTNLRVMFEEDTERPQHAVLDFTWNRPNS
jgi:hypothetical protein